MKVLAWYRPDASDEVLRHQRRYVEEIGQQCRRHDIAFVLELLVYPFPKAAGHTTDYVEAIEKRPELVIESVREFAQPRYGVDLFKLESPLPGATPPPRDESAAHRQAQRWFDMMGEVCRAARIPWVMLSGGVTPAQFLRVMEYAYAAGAHGFLAGRAIAAFNALTRRRATAWSPDYSAFARIRAEGEFCAGYA